jgi:hypothetical protein
MDVMVQLACHDLGPDGFHHLMILREQDNAMVLLIL